VEPLLVCAGNADRGDDGVGLAAAERLWRMGVAARLAPADATLLLDAWRESDCVVLVDAIYSGLRPAGWVWCRRITSDRELTPGPARRFTAHGLGLADALRLARTLGCWPARLWLTGIEAAQFEPGAGLTPAVERSLDCLCRLACRLG
jgi:hydrogenase maturation protease